MEVKDDDKDYRFTIFFNKVFTKVQLSVLYSSYSYIKIYENVVSITPFVSQDLNITGKTDFV